MKSKTKKIVTLLIALVMIGSLIAGCQPAPAPVAEQPAAPAAPAAPAEPAAPAAEPFKLVWYVPAPHPYFEEVRVGVEACEKELGIEVQYQVGPDWQQNSQNQNMEALAALGNKYFAVYPSDASGANSLYEELVANGATIVNFGTSTLLPTTASFAVATDVKVAAMQAAEELIKAMGGKGNIINVLEVLEDPNTVLRKQGIEEVVAKYPDVTIIQEVSGMATVEAALEKINSALSANLDKVDGIITTGYTPTVALSQVLTEYKEKGGEREIHGVGIDTDEITMKAIRDGVLDGTIVQNPFGHGYLSCLLLNYVHQGYTPKADTYFVNGGFAYAHAGNIDNYNVDIEAATAEIKSALLDTYLTK
jgi:ribose transport system substrate-binding protein